MIKNFLKSKIGNKINIKLFTNKDGSGHNLKCDIIDIDNEKLHLFVSIESFVPSGYIKSGSEHNIGDLFIEYNKIETINELIDKILDILEIKYIDRVITL